MVEYSKDMRCAYYKGFKFTEFDNGYYRGSQSKTSAYKKLLHRFVYETETGTIIPKGFHIHHIDGNKKNNNLSNLTLVQNRFHAIIHNTPEKTSLCVKRMAEKNKKLDYPGLKKGRECQKANGYQAIKKANEKNKKPVLMFSVDGKFIERYDSINTAAHKLGKRPSQISRCAKGYRKTALSYMWRFEDGNINTL